MANETSVIGDIKHLSKALKAVAGGAEAEFFAVKGTAKPPKNAPKDGAKQVPQQAVAFYVGQEGKTKYEAEKKLFASSQTVRGEIKASKKKAGRLVLECLGTPTLARDAAILALKEANLITYKLIAMKKGESEPMAEDEKEGPVENTPAQSETPEDLKNKLSALLPDILSLIKNDRVLGDQIKVLQEKMQKKLLAKNYEGAAKTLHEIEVLVATSRGAAQGLRERPLQIDETTEQWQAEIDLNDYAPGKQLGAGNFGTTYLLEANTPDSPRLIFKEPKNDVGRKDMEEEAAFYEMIGDHPNFAKCMGMSNVNGKEGLVLELVDGKNSEKTFDELRDKYEKGEIKHEEFWGAIQFTLQRTLEAVDFMASKGVVHNDIKPDNIMIDAATGEVKLIDLGAAGKVGEKNEKMVPIGAGVVAPELFGNKMTKQSDVFGVGGTAHRLGEEKYFNYADSQDKRSRVDRLTEFANSAQTDDPKKALNVQDPDGPEMEVSEVDSRGNRKKVPGRYATESAYTDFVNRLMHPDPKQRLTPKEALEHPFMKTRFLADEDARNVLKKTLQPKETTGPILTSLDAVLEQGVVLQSFVTPDGQPLAGKLAEVRDAALKIFQPFQDKQQEIRKHRAGFDKEMAKAAKDRDLDLLKQIDAGVLALAGELNPDSIRPQLTKTQQMLVKFGASAGKETKDLPKSKKSALRDDTVRDENNVFDELTKKQAETKKTLDQEADKRAKEYDAKRIAAFLEETRKELEAKIPSGFKSRAQMIRKALGATEKFLKDQMAKGQEPTEAPLDMVLRILRDMAPQSPPPQSGTNGAQASVGYAKSGDLDPAETDASETGEGYIFSPPTDGADNQLLASSV